MPSSVDEGQIRSMLRATPGQRLESHDKTYAEVPDRGPTRRRPRLPEWPEFHLVALLKALAEGGVDFVVVGGIAAVAHGSPQITQDLDIAYAGDDENLARLGAVLVGLGATLRGVAEAVPFVPDGRTLRGTRMLTLDTREGRLDVLAEPEGSGGTAPARQCDRGGGRGRAGADRRPRGSDRDEEGGRGGRRTGSTSRSSRPSEGCELGRTPGMAAAPRASTSSSIASTRPRSTRRTGRARLRLRVEDVGDWDFVIRGGSMAAGAGGPQPARPTRACAPTAPPGRGWRATCAAG